MHIHGKVTLARNKWKFISDDEILVVHEASDDGEVYKVASKATYFRVK
jgi:hypothetical protein